MKVDFLTLFLVLGLTDILQAVAIFLQYISHKNQKEVKIWAYGFASVAIGFILLFFRAQIPFLFVSIILANALFNLGALLIYIGIVRFLGQKENKQFLLWIVILFFLSFFYFTYYKSDINVRTIITSCLVALMSLLTGYTLFTKKTKEINLSASFLATIFSIHGLFYIVRTIINLTVSPIHELLNPATIQTVTYLVQITEGILVTFGLIIMVNQRTHSETEEAKNHFQLIFSTSPDAVLISSVLDGKIIEINDAFTFLTGYTREELIGSSTLARNIWKNAIDRQKVVEALQKQGHCENMQAVYLKKDGTEVYGSLSAKFINLKGSTHIISITRDVTNLKQTKEELLEIDEKYRILYESAGIGIGYYKPDGTVISYNRLAAQNMGGKPEDFNGKSIFQLFPRQEADFYLGRINRAVTEEKPMIYEDLVPLPGGDKYFLSTFNKIKDNDNKVLGVQIISQDITERKLAENEIKKLNEQLEENVKHRTQELEQSNKELEDFAYSISHDLRAPLRAIDGFSHILLEQYQPKLDAEAFRILSVIRDNTHKMDHLIYDLLTMAKITRASLKKESLNMNIILESVLFELTKKMDIKKIKICIDQLPLSYGDGSLIHMVWVNLLENAIKFTGSKEVRKITIQGCQKDDQSIYKITDNGIGFNPAYSSKLFKPFHTLHSQYEFPENTGIGLAIVERIVSRHSGKVWAEGEEGVGATFYFSLPIETT